MTHLIFFDINGTLIERDSRTDLPFACAVNQLLSVNDAMAGVNTSARSDQDVFMEILNNFGLAYSDEKWQDFLSLYEIQLKEWEHTDVWRPNADALDFVKNLSKTDHKLSLITGELTMGAAYKLTKLGIWNHFPTGGFGEHGLRRFDIASYALAAAKTAYGLTDDWFETHSCFVIGDTVLDIQTARHIGAKSIAIATGSNTKEELAAEGPDYLIERFEEIAGLFLD